MRLLDTVAQGIPMCAPSTVSPSESSLFARTALPIPRPR